MHWVSWFTSWFWYYNARITLIRKCRNIYRCMINLNKFNNPTHCWARISRAPRVGHICQRCVEVPSKSHQNLMARLLATAAWCNYFTKYNLCAISCKQMKTYENESHDITKYYIVFVCAPNRINRIKLTADSIYHRTSTTQTDFAAWWRFQPYDVSRFCSVADVVDSSTSASFVVWWRSQHVSISVNDVIQYHMTICSWVMPARKRCCCVSNIVR